MNSGPNRSKSGHAHSYMKNVHRDPEIALISGQAGTVLSDFAKGDRTPMAAADPPRTLFLNLVNGTEHGNANALG